MKCYIALRSPFQAKHINDSMLIKNLVRWHYHNIILENNDIMLILCYLLDKHSVLVQDFLSGWACCANQYHYKSLSRRVVMRLVHATGTVFSVFLVSTTFSLFMRGPAICSLIKMISCSVKPYLSNSPLRLLLVNIWSNIITEASSCWNIITVLLFILLIQDQLLPLFWEVIPSEMHLA